MPGRRSKMMRVPIRDGTLDVVTSVTDISFQNMDIRRMPHKYPNILIHFVFSTKERANMIPAELLPMLWKYFAGIGRNHGLPVLAAGGTSNHSHLLIALPSDMAPAKAVQVLKANSSRWIRQHGIAFAWQEGYGAFSVSSSNKTAVREYIEHQAEHHRSRSFETEFETMIRKSGMRFDSVEAFG
jgi:REP element-mobilizing transposase RayT